jgi:hypothetical protein
MLTPEGAKRALETFKVQGEADELEQRLHNEPAEIAAIGLAFLQSTRDGFRDANVDAEHQRLQLRCSIDSLDAGARARLLQALFPPIAKAVEASWEMQCSINRDERLTQTDVQQS